LNSVAEISDQELAHSQFEATIMNVLGVATLEKTELFEQELDAAQMNQASAINEDGLFEKLVGNMYARVLKLKKGTFITGQVHKRPYIDIFVYGDATCKSFLSDGTIEGVSRVDQFCFLAGLAGRKRLIYAHEDSMWVTVDPTDAKRIEDVPEDVVFKRMREYQKFTEVSQ